MTTLLDPAELARLEALAKAASPGPWDAVPWDDGWWDCKPHPEEWGVWREDGLHPVGLRMCEADAKLLREAPEAIPALVAEVKRDREVMAATEAVGRALAEALGLAPDADPSAVLEAAREARAKLHVALHQLGRMAQTLQVEVDESGWMNLPALGAAVKLAQEAVEDLPRTERERDEARAEVERLREALEDARAQALDVADSCGAEAVER